MKRAFETRAFDLVKITMVTLLAIVMSSAVVRTTWGGDTRDASQLPPGQSFAGALTTGPEATLDVDQMRAQIRFLSVPTDLVESIADWSIVSFGAAELAAADPFSVMNQPLRRRKAVPADQSQGQVSSQARLQIPSTHKVLDEEAADSLLRGLFEDERTRAVFAPQLAFVDSITATAVTGKQKPFVVGWKDDAPQTRVVSEGKMIRLRTVTERDTVWLDYDVVMSRILSVTSRSIRVAGRQQPVHLAVPEIETNKADGTVELPLGGTVLIGGLPAESDDGESRQMLIAISVNRMHVNQNKSRPAAEAKSPENEAVATSKSDLPVAKSIAKKVDAHPTEPSDKAAKSKRRNPFSLISRILNRTPQQSDSEDKEKRAWSKLLDDSEPEQKPFKIHGGVR